MGIWVLRYREDKKKAIAFAAIAFNYVESLGLNASYRTLSNQNFYFIF